MNVDHLHGHHGERIAAAVVNTTRKVEDYIDRMVTAAVPAASTKKSPAPTPVDPNPIPGALTLA